MAKKPSEAFAMSDEDEFFESSSEKETGDESAEQETDDSGEPSEEGTGDDSGTGDEGSEEEGSGEEAGETESEEGDQSEESEEGAETTNAKTGEGETSQEEEGDAAEEGGADEDIFAELGDEGSEASEAVSFKRLGSALDIELENDTEEEFTEKVKKLIDDSKQQVDLSKFDPEAQRLVKHLNENGGKIGDFFVNPRISQLQSVLSMSAEDKYSNVRKAALVREGVPEDKMDEQIKSELSNMTAQQIVGAANKIDEDAKKLIASEIEQIVGESEQHQTEIQKEREAEMRETREKVKSFVEKQDDFLGLELSEKAKKSIIQDVNSGRFDQTIDLTDAEIRLAAYMIKRHGGRIKSWFKKEISERSRDSHNKGVEKITSKLHRSKQEAQRTGTGHQEASSGTKNLDNWGSLDI